jgi:glycosyltransferase involved in cell wall biosynthesis
MDRLQFSVVIPTYNRKEGILACLDALAHQSADPASFEVVVVDDGSLDGTSAALVGMKHPFVVQLLSNPHGGASAARNAGIAAARGEYVAFTEDDVVVEKDWLHNAALHLADGTVDVLEGRTVDNTTAKEVRRFEGKRLPSFIPCNLFVRRPLFARVGGFDPAFHDTSRGLYFREDADLGFRLIDAGCQVAIANDVVVGHPPQFLALGDCLRHARRYMFDPLLYKKHPLRFRQFIEVKRVLGLTIHRPQHYVALLYAALLVWLIGAVIVGSWQTVIPVAVLAFCCSMFFRYKYKGMAALQLYNIKDTIGFMVLPLVYLASLVRGCFHFRSFGALL